MKTKGAIVKLNRKTLRKMIIESLLQEQRKSNPKVKTLQGKIGMDVKDQDGFWGDDTNAAWVLWLKGVSEENDNPLLVNAGSDWQTFGNSPWAKDFNYSGNIDGVLNFIDDIEGGLHKEEGAKEKLKATVEKEEGSEQKAEETKRKEGAKDIPKKKEKPKPKLRYSEPSGNTKTSIDPLRIPASQIQNFLNTRIKFSDNTMISDVPKKSWWNRYTEFDGRTITDQEIKSAAIAKVAANKNITPTTKRKITKETTSSLNQMKGRALPVRPMMKDTTEIDVAIFRDYQAVRDKKEIMDCAVVIRYLYKDFGDPTPIPLIAITNLKYSEKQGVYAMTKVNESKNKLDSKLLRRLILKTLKEHGEL